MGRAADHLAVKGFGLAGVSQKLQDRRQIVRGLQQGRIEVNGGFIAAFARIEFFPLRPEIAQKAPGEGVFGILFDQRFEHTNGLIELSALPQEVGFDAMILGRDAFDGARPRDQVECAGDVSQAGRLEASVVQRGGVIRGRDMIGRVGPITLERRVRPPGRRTGEQLRTEPSLRRRRCVEHVASLDTLDKRSAPSISQAWFKSD
ncbi:MAG TPA: hypothetical protein VMD53_14945 [Rhizomicrobium sp.]|nr:hypothetical protein [Rhizomicrobium sp.]